MEGADLGEGVFSLSTFNASVLNEFLTMITKERKEGGRKEVGEGGREEGRTSN